MKASELQIGDRIFDLNRNRADRVDEVCKERVYLESENEYLFWDEIEPIPLTDLILYKSEFDPMDIAWFGEHDEDGNVIGYHFEIRGCNIFIEARFNYVHELQHAIRLAGLDLEVWYDL